MSVQVPFPIIIAKEGKWFVASCPLLDLATQGRSESEVKENMVDLINDYLSDPDTPKPTFEDLFSLSLANIAIKVPEGVLHSEASSVVLAKSIDILQSNGFREVRSSNHTTFKKTVGIGFSLLGSSSQRGYCFVIQYIIKQSEKPRLEFEL